MKTGLSMKIALGLILGACVMAFAGAAHAATYVNLYGTNEEYNFWTNEGLVLLKTAPLNCTATTKFLANPTTSGVIVGSGCAAAYSSDTAPTNDGYIYFSFTNKASWDGIDAVNNFYDADNWGTFNPNTNQYVPLANPCGATNYNQRQVATCVDGACGGTATYTCQDIHIGVSNLEAAGVIQNTYGTLKGPLDPSDNPTWRQFPPTGPSTANLPSSVQGTVPVSLNGLPASTTYQNPTAPLVYPFAFYVNPGVTTTRCSASSPATTTTTAGVSVVTSNVDNFCLDDSSCGGTAGNHTYCTAQTIDNISRLQVVALFSGAIANWSDFGGYYVPNLPVTLCLRHAGAGTLSVLDVGVMNGADNTGWGAPLVNTENRVTSSQGPPYVYFNDLVSDELNCLNWADGGPITSSGQTQYAGSDTLPSNVKGGAIGFADADNASTQTYVEIKYNGVTANRVTVRDGIYDNFWTNDRLYVPGNLTTAQLAIYGTMLSLVSNPANITNATVGSPRGNYYGSSNESNFPKGTSTFYPYIYTPATGTDAQTP